LHHRHTGEVVISILLLQDLIAIVVLMVMKGLDSEGMELSGIIQLVIALPSLLLVAWALEHFLLQPLFARFDRFPEYVFLLAIGWCLGVAQSAEALGLTYEIGAFIGGVAVATSPIARHIADSLRPLRDFFLIMFFFAIGAGFDVAGAREIWWGALLLAAGVLLLKPLVYRLLLVGVAESRELGLEIGWRLGQMSEFSLLIVFIAAQSGLISGMAVNLVQLATLLTFVGSSYLVVLRYPTPIALSDRLRRD
ncbi:MAG: cation:proton antiporter, partial [Arenicellales bacterium]|nr:cation:proton antiporter [Arenicellales bacterium]